MRVLIVMCALCVSGGVALAQPGRGGLEASAPEGLKMNQLQAMGTHNSFKSLLPAAELALIAERSPQAARALDYGHPSITAQLDLGMRQLEIDVVHDPQGGLYATPRLPQRSGVFYDNSALHRPGLKAIHIPDIDARSNCATFVACLSQLRDWSSKHPRHVPILVTINANEDAAAVDGAVVPAIFDEAALRTLDDEIRSVMDPQHLITPDQVRGAARTLREAVLNGGWPRLEAARGKIFFLLDESQEKIRLYMGKSTSLEGKLAFVNSHREDADHAAIFVLNEPFAEFDRIQRAVQAGFIVRTRADEATEEARTNDTRRLARALASGAQYVSTDYPVPRPDFSPYQARLPDHEVARLNPVARPALR